MATVTKRYAPPYMVYMNWKTGLIVQFVDQPSIAELAAAGLEQVLLCRDDKSGDLFVDPAITLDSVRHSGLSHVSLRMFVDQVGESPGCGDFRIEIKDGLETAIYKGDYRSATLVRSIVQQDTFMGAMGKLAVSVDRLADVIDGLIGVKG